MTEKEALAREIARDGYGLSESCNDVESEFHIGLVSRLPSSERRAFDAGWEAARQYYTNQPKVENVQS